jgi:CRP-like cAMP-binding protein
MPRDPDRGDAQRNHLLAALPPLVLERLKPYLRTQTADQGDVLVHAGQPVERVCFPTAGLFSLVVMSGNGDVVEAAVAGREGMLGSAVVLGDAPSTFQELCQVDGAYIAVPSAALCAEMACAPSVRDLFLPHIAALLHATARNVVCNRLHTTEQRLARWLLQVRDRLEADTFYLTQEFLGHMLGVRRPTVTVSVGALQRAGLIRHQRGRIRVVDGVGLARAACEDYAHIRAAYEGL